MPGNTADVLGVLLIVSDRVTRRTFLSAISALSALGAPPQPKKAREIPRVGEFVRYIDPLTENPLVRLTSLASANYLPAPQNAFISARSRFLVFSSDRAGKLCPHLMDLRSGVVRQLAETAALDPLSLSLDRSERFLFFLDGGTLKQAQLSGRRETTVTEGVTAFTGRSAGELLVVRQNQLRRVTGETLASDITTPCLLSPNGGLCLVRHSSGQECEICSVAVRAGKSPVRLAAGLVRLPFWSPDSQSVLLLRDMDRNGIRISEIHQISLDGSPEQTVSTTGQFAAFAPNGDASVFAAASRSKAQPAIELLLRSPKRELTLCEHHAAHPESVGPVFAPDSRRLYFQSDREGKAAIYSINVEKLVEPTAFE